LPAWESTTWIAVGAFALAALLLALSIVLALRLQHGGGALDRCRHELERAWERVRRERAASTRARNELHWLRNLAEVGACESVDGALRRVLESATGLSRSAAAMLALPRADGNPLVATFGLTPGESAHDLLGFPPGGNEARAVSLSYRYTEEEAARDEFHLSSGLALPVLDVESGHLGTLAVFWRRLEHDVTDEELERLEGLAAALGPLLRTIFRLEELQEAVDLDATGLPGRRTLRDALAVECARAQRYFHPLSLLLLRAAGDPEDVRAAAERLPADVRLPDRVHHLGDGRFAVLLPESSRVDAERLWRRLQLALGEGRTPAAFVELRQEDDAVSLLERAESALAGVELAADSGIRAVEPGG
jgi:GGDEF domain-containing protein